MHHKKQGGGGGTGANRRKSKSRPQDSALTSAIPAPPRLPPPPRLPFFPSTNEGFMAQKIKGAKQPKQQQSTRPGREKKMTPKPEAEVPHQIGTGKLKNKVAIITGGDSGIGR